MSVNAVQNDVSQPTGQLGASVDACGVRLAVGLYGASVGSGE